jgi:hypothetical protein
VHPEVGLDIRVQVRAELLVNQQRLVDVLGTMHGLGDSLKLQAAVAKLASNYFSIFQSVWV